MRLSEHFTLEEMVESDLARRHGIDNTPVEREIHNLVRLCEEILEPLRYRVKRSIFVSSGFRCLTLNRVLRSKDTSDHVQGLAADIKVDGMAPMEVCRIIERMNLPYRQLIHEFGSWTHVSDSPEGVEPTRTLLTIDHLGTRAGILAAR